MNSFYYLAAYTAAAAVGFTGRQCAAIARAARYTEDCQGHTASNDSSAEGVLLRSVFHYPPGDVADILKLTRPDFLSEAGAEAMAALRLVCLPGGQMMTQTAELARKGWRAQLSEETRCQQLGITAHILLDSVLHQGFSGADDPAVNGAAGVLAAKPSPPEKLRGLLERTRTEPLAEIFSMEAVIPDPSAGPVGCAQVEALASSPAAIFSYASVWQQKPLAAWVNPFRFAGAYTVLKAVFQYVRGSSADWTKGQVDEDGLMDLAVFFAGLPDEMAMEREWALYFNWLPEMEPYREPALPRDQLYLRGFQFQAMELRSLLLDTCPALRAYAQLLDQAAPEEPLPSEDAQDPAEK